jgi:mannose-6-phosphate isomerase
VRPEASGITATSPILRLPPLYRAYRFGGGGLARWGRESLPAGGAAESWEVSPHPALPSVVADGPLAGVSLVRLAQLWGEALGRTGQGKPGFPFLLKVLDVTQDLPVHVHPTDEQAAELPGNDPGKDEAWYVLEAAPDAAVWLGFDRPLSRGEAAALARRGTLRDAMRRHPVAAGDVVFVPARTAHSARGVLFLEIQEVSDRSIFADRTDVWGRPYGEAAFEAELERFVTVADLAAPAPPPRRPRESEPGRSTLGAHRHFAWERYRLAPGETVRVAPRPVGQAFTAVSGSGVLAVGDRQAPLDRAGSLAVPAEAAQREMALKGGPVGLVAVRSLGPA